MSSPAGELFPYPNDPALSALAIAGMVTAVEHSAVWHFFFCRLCEPRRQAPGNEFNAVDDCWWWCCRPAWMVLGFFIYFLMREPLPYNCPQCRATVGARFNYCPNCKCNLRPSCPQCKREVGELDKFCPYCATELNSANVSARNRRAATSAARSSAACFELHHLHGEGHGVAAAQA